MSRPRRTAAVCLALPPLALGACGGGSSAKDAITKIIKDGGRDPATICTHLAPALLTQAGGLKGCQASAKAGDDRKDAVDIKALQIKGDAATAQIVGARGPETVTFARQGGHWVVTRTS